MEIVIIILLILLNGLLSMSEIALVSSRQARLETEARRGSRAARTALKLTGDPDKFLSTIQIGITLIGILTGLYSGEKFAQDVGALIARIEPLAPYSVTIAKILIVTVVTYLTLIIGELVPKRIGMNAPERVSKLVAKPMYVLSVIASPFVWLLSKSTTIVLRITGTEVEKSKVTEEEIKAIIQEGMEGGEIRPVEQDIVERVFNLGDRNVNSIMTHRTELTWLDINDTSSVNRDKVKGNLFNTYPVADSELDNIVGVAYLKDLFGKMESPEFRLDDVISPAQYLPENMSVYNALEKMKRESLKSGIVIDEYGSIQGIVTLKDIVNALLGEMLEAGEERDIVERADGSWLVDGQCPFYDFLDHFDMEEFYSDENYATLSGLILNILEHIPRTGETLRWQNFQFEIVDMDGARIDKVLVSRTDGNNE